MPMRNCAFCVSFFIKIALIWCSARPCADRTGFARQVVHLLAFFTTRPALALVRRAERRVHLPKDAEPLAGGRSRLRLRSDSACVGGWEHPLHRYRRCAHRETGWCALHISRPGSPQHMRRHNTYYDSLHDVWAWEQMAATDHWPGMQKVIDLALWHQKFCFGYLSSWDNATRKMAEIREFPKAIY